MNFNEYQDLAKLTANKALSADLRLAVLGLGLAGETGELIERLKKAIGHDIALDYAHATEELGDILWYIAVIAAALGIPLHVVAALNVEKLRARYPEGFVTGGGIRT